MGKQKINMREEEELAIEVRKYICLYDKSSPTYKDKRAKANAWSRVEEALGLEEGQGESRFENLKRRYRIRKNALRKATPSGTGRTKNLDKIESELKVYEFIRWLDPFVAGAVSTSNLDSEDETTEEAYNFPEIPPPDDENSDEQDDEQGDEQDEESDKESDKENTPEKPEKPEKPLKKLPTGIPSFKKKKVTSDDLLATINKRLHDKKHSKKGQKPQDECDAFGVVVANELRSLPKRKQMKLKHEINLAIYKFQCEVENEEMHPVQINATPPPPVYVHPTQTYTNLINFPGQITDTGILSPTGSTASNSSVNYKRQYDQY